uniref:Cytochrome b5 n=1 Tax=Santalum album TaxID=35974 RepID=A0A219T3K9_SANAL|nr:cytochrome b5 [Santalum album]
MEGEGKVFTLSEVSEHNSSKDCWLIIEGKVYDVTKFLEDHPGGDAVLISATGKDATDDFEDVGHSSTARAMLEEWYIGDMDTSTIPARQQFTPPTQPHHDQARSSEFFVKLLQFLVPLLILGLAVGIRFYTKSA